MTSYVRKIWHIWQYRFVYEWKKFSHSIRLQEKISRVRALELIPFSAKSNCGPITYTRNIPKFTEICSFGCWVASVAGSGHTELRYTLKWRFVNKTKAISNDTMFHTLTVLRRRVYLFWTASLRLRFFGFLCFLTMFEMCAIPTIRCMLWLPADNSNDTKCRKSSLNLRKIITSPAILNWSY